MRNFAANFWNFKSGTGLHCVWVRVHEDGRDRLVSMWIDPASSAAKSQLPGTIPGTTPETKGGIELAVSSCDALATDDGGQPDVEHEKFALRG